MTRENEKKFQKLTNLAVEVLKEFAKDGTIPELVPYDIIHGSRPVLLDEKEIYLRMCARAYRDDGRLSQDEYERVGTNISQKLSSLELFPKRRRELLRGMGRHCKQPRRSSL